MGKLALSFCLTHATAGTAPIPHDTSLDLSGMLSRQSPTRAYE